MAEDKGSQATRRLSNIKVKEVSVVDVAAIQRTFLVVKRDETMTKKIDQTVDSAANSIIVVEKTTEPVVIAEKSVTVPVAKTETAGVEAVIAKHYGYGSDEPSLYISMDGPLLQLLPIFAQMSQNMTTEEQSSLAKRALEAVEKGVDAIPEEVEVEKAKRMTASRATLLDNAIESLSALKDEFADKSTEEVVEEVTDVVTEATDGVAKAKELAGQTEAFAAIAKSFSAMADVLKGLNEKIDKVEAKVEKSDERATKTEEKIEAVEKTQPAAHSEAPETTTTPVEKTKSNRELFSGIIG